ncbi:ABC transporter ATP-binding protein [Streptomyces alboflavus]|uniref:ABC transporter ATP-binding protein n=1 Tax=Streptomyces alboflavus TaxID=67267 RepID=UPI0004C11EEB|nr:ABC transporter ATP-binding protein [Streptomyces alboflavus]
MATDVHRPVTGPSHRADASHRADTSYRAATSRPADIAARDTDGTGPTPATVVRVDGLTRAFDDRAVIDRLHLDVRAGEFVALLGRSGCGKSTLLRILAGLDRDIEGTVLVPRRKAVAFQAPRLMPWKRVWRNVLLGLPGKPERAVAERALEEVGLGHRSHAWPKTLSGGEAQRASLARALVREPDLLLLDEPFGALDALTRVKAQRLVGELWQRRGCAVLLVTHDVEEAVLLADRVLVMDEGVIAHEQRIDLPRPRDIADPRFAALRTGLLERLGVETPSTADAPTAPSAATPTPAAATAS